MKKILLVLKNILWTVIGFFFIPFSVLGFLLATNTTKGIGVYNEDGKLFIPVGILLLAILIVFCTIRIVRLVKTKMPEKKKEIISCGCFISGILVYLIYWLCTSLIFN